MKRITRSWSIMVGGGLELRNKFRLKLILALTILCAVGILLWQTSIERGCGYWSQCEPLVELEEEWMIEDEGAEGTTTATCKIPKLPVMPEYFQKHWNPKPMEKCDNIQQVIELGTVNEVGKISPNLTGSCCIQEVIRGKNDGDYRFTDCRQYTPGTRLPNNSESLFVTCNKDNTEVMNAEANIPIKSRIEAKLKHWKGIQERPISVFILGIDSVSRSHAYRSLPKSLEVMKRLDFLDFQGYHSVAPSTLTNFMSLLIGLTRPSVRETCAKDWESPFDSCPFIWKNFSDANYITAYFEDDDQSFNWGGQSGFTDQPVDYYLHHWFLAVKKFRESENGAQNKGCPSRETMPEFLVRHSKRFLHTFATVPFFAFTFWAYPFHDEMYALADFDSQLVHLLEYLESKKELLDRTLFIFLSDHGDRTSFFNSKSVESYIERGLPPLFIRLPEVFKRKHPKMYESLKKNTNQLVTPFDLHQTLHHLLSLECSGRNRCSVPGKGVTPISPVEKYRSSLFVHVPNNRTCATTSIPLAHCVCNLEYAEANSSELNMVEAKSLLSAEINSVALEFAVNKLNQKVQQSKYYDLCEEWRASPSDILYTRVVGKTGRFVEIVLAFRAWPGEAQFEARIKVAMMADKERRRYGQLVGFARINRYGDQSWCVGKTSDSDKQMREICMCKVQKH